MDLSKAKTFKGFLSKDSPSLFGGYQKRFFQIIEGDLNKGEPFLITYAEKENGQLKGAIPFAQISEINSLSKKEFCFLVGDSKTFKLKAENESIKNDWIDAIKIIKKENTMLLAEFGKERSSSMYSTKDKSWKIQNQSKEVINTLSNQGVTINQNEGIKSDKCIEIKGLKSLLRGINPELLKVRMKHGFVMKKHKSNFMSSQKRWLFLISARPLTNEDQLKDEETLDQNTLPSSLKFDVLYYYSVEDEQDTSTSKGELIMSECSRISTKEVDKEFILIIDMNDRIFEFSCENNWERDSWFEAFKNSKTTGKEIELSKTKKPRNIISLLELGDNNQAIEKIVEKEIATLVKGFEEIKNFQILSAMIKKMDSKLTQLVDGCLLTTPLPLNIIKSYVEKFNTTILNKVQQYWRFLCENLSVSYSINIRLIKY